MSQERALVPIERIEKSIIVIRAQRVLLDSDLAELYGVTTKRFNEQVKRNRDRFPPDFMFQLTESEAANLRSHFATSSSGHGGRRYSPYAFTEHGAVMAAMVLNSKRAIEASVYVVRAFIQLREMLSANKELERKLATHDIAIREIVDTIKHLMTLPLPPEGEQEKPRIGFRVKEALAPYRRNKHRAR